MRLCSACLLGLKCRYDGNSKPDARAIALAGKETLVPVCPEQLGGLPTPRESSEIRDGKAVTKSGRDVTRNFEAGAEATLDIAKILGVKGAILKQCSPSCGSGRIYDGSFTGRTIEGDGFTAALLKKNGIKVISEGDL